MIWDFGYRRSKMEKIYRRIRTVYTTANTVARRLSRKAGHDATASAAATTRAHCHGRIASGDYDAPPHPVIARRSGKLGHDACAGVRGFIWSASVSSVSPGVVVTTPAICSTILFGATGGIPTKTTHQVLEFIQALALDLLYHP
jgi:hypothetical protein